MKKIISMALISTLSLALLTGCVVQDDDMSDIQILDENSTDNKEDTLKEIAINFESGNVSYDEVLDELEKNEITEQEFNEYSESWNYSND